MANYYKVPQDVEADDKLLGPFTFRQFIYLIILCGLLAVGWALANIFIPLALIPLPFIIFFTFLALPLRKDQPMETYFAALISFYMKPRTRFWMPGQRETTIEITAPKKIEKPRTRNISGSEASHRLSFLANIVDSEGYAIHNNSTPIRQEFLAEARTATDIFDTNSSPLVNQILVKEEREKRQEVVNQMKVALSRTQSLTLEQQQKTPPSIARHFENPTQEPKPNPVLNDLAHNTEYSVETISKEAARLSSKQSSKPPTNPDQDEVFISLH